MTDWNKLTLEEKCRILGQEGEKFAYNRLLKKYPLKKYLILDLHQLCEMDWAVIDTDKDEIVALYEVKTTTKNKRKFSAGSNLQLEIFTLFIKL